MSFVDFNSMRFTILIFIFALGYFPQHSFAQQTVSPDDYIKNELLPNIEKDMKPTPWYKPRESYIEVSVSTEERDVLGRDIIWYALQQTDLASSFSLGLGTRTYYLGAGKFPAAKKFLEKYLNDEIVTAALEAKKNEAERLAQIKTQELDQQRRMTIIKAGKPDLIGQWFSTGSDDKPNSILFITEKDDQLIGTFCNPNMKLLPNVKLACDHVHQVKMRIFFPNPASSTYCTSETSAQCEEIIQPYVGGESIKYTVENERGNTYYLYNKLTPDKLAEALHPKPHPATPVIAAVAPPTVDKTDLPRQLRLFPSQWIGIHGTDALLRIRVSSEDKNSIKVQVCQSDPLPAVGSPCLPLDPIYKALKIFSYEAPYRGFIDHSTHDGIRITSSGALVWFDYDKTNEGETDEKLLKHNSNIYAPVDAKYLTERALIDRTLAAAEKRQKERLVGDWYHFPTPKENGSSIFRIFNDKEILGRLLGGFCEEKEYKESKGKNCVLPSGFVIAPIIFSRNARAFCILSYPNCQLGLRMFAGDDNTLTIMSDPTTQTDRPDQNLEGSVYSRISKSLAF